MTEQEIECMECGKKFTRDTSLPKWRKLYQECGSVADQCDECLTQWLKEQ